MDKIKFIHAADLHLDSPFKGLHHLPLPIFGKLKESTFASFHRVIEAAVSQQVDFVLIAGDLFDDQVRSLKAQISIRNGFEKLAQAGIPVYVIHGNHDHLSGSWARINWPENVHFFKEDVQVHSFIKNGKTLAHIYGFSYPERAVTEKMVQYYQKQDGALFHIGMLHGNLEGKEGHDPYAPFTINELLEKEFDYWALGHIHKQQILNKDPYIIYPGNIQGRHRKESGEKGCFLIELDRNESRQRFISCAPIVWEALVFDTSQITSVDDLLIALNKNKEFYRNSNKGTLLTIELIGNSHLHHQLNDRQFLSELCEIINEGEEYEDSFVWATACHNHTSKPYNKSLLQGESHFISDLLYQIDNYNEKIFNDALSTLLKNRKVKALLPNLEQDRQTIIEEAERLLLQELLKE